MNRSAGNLPSVVTRLCGFSPSSVIGPILREKGFHAGQGSRTEVMFHALGITVGVRGGDSDGHQELSDEFVTFPSPSGQPRPPGGEGDRTVGLLPDKPFPHQPAENPGHGHVTDPHFDGEIGDPTPRPGLEEVLNGLDVVLRRLGGVIPPGFGIVVG